MILPPVPALVLIGALVVERLFELVLSRRRLHRSRGVAAGNELEWRALVLVHVGLLLLPPAEAIGLGTRGSAIGLWSGVALEMLAQALRYWSIRTLGRAWNARAVVDPEFGFVERGPYLWIRHPNYLAVLIEFTAVPLAFGAWRSWLFLNLLHFPLIARRVQEEERLLRAIPGYAERMESKGRFWPRRRRRDA